MGITALPYFTVLLNYTYEKIFKFSVCEHKKLLITVCLKRMLKTILRTLKALELKDIVESNNVNFSRS